MITKSTLADKGMFIAPTKISAAAMLDNKMLEFFCSSFLDLTAAITKMFKMTAAGDAIDTIATITQGKILSVGSHAKFGLCGQEKTDLMSDETFIVACISLLTVDPSISILV